MTTILTIEDNIETQLLLKKALEPKYNVKIFYNLATAREYLKSNQVDLILLDLMLPDGMGLNLFKDFGADKPAARTPIIILSSLTDVKTKIIGLESGADDYILKPFDHQELIARIESVLRRGPTRHTESTITFADIVVDLANQSACYKKHDKVNDLSLTPIEFKILLSLTRQFGTQIPRDTLKDIVWGDIFVSKRNVDTHICKLRKKLEDTTINILNKRGKGYFVTTSNSNDSSGSDSVDNSVNSDLMANKETENELPAFGINKHGFANSEEVAPLALGI